MLTSNAQSYLTQLVTEERTKADRKDPYTKIKEIHIGYVHADLRSEFEQATSEKQNFMLCMINGIPIIVNRLCEGGYRVIFKESDKPAEIKIGGVAPSKAWLRRYRIKQ